VRLMKDPAPRLAQSDAETDPLPALRPNRELLTPRGGRDDPRWLSSSIDSGSVQADTHVLGTASLSKARGICVVFHQPSIRLCGSRWYRQREAGGLVHRHREQKRRAAVRVR
jgi:hypothetical protein